MSAYLNTLGLAALGCVASVVSAQEFKLTASDGAAGDQFGQRAAISGNTVVVGASNDDGTTGSAYLFDVTNPSAAVETAKLLASDGEAGDYFGLSVAIGSDTVIIGASQAGSGGAAYLFDVTSGQQLAKMVASDGASGDHFGWSVAINGDTAIVGSKDADGGSIETGCAYLFDVSSPSAPVQIGKLVASDGAPDDYFGDSVTIRGNAALVGAFGDDDNGSKAGSAYLFDITIPSAPVQTAKLLASDGAAGDFFGTAVAINDSTALVGASWADSGGSNSGAAYLFDVGTGQQIAKLLPNDGGGGDLFGGSVAVSGNTAIVGAMNADGITPVAGSAYLFDISTGSAAVQIAKLVASDGATSAQFGNSVAIDGSTCLVGARLSDAGGYQSGAAYLYPLGASCTPRSGILGLNPADYACLTPPALGTTWSTQISTTPTLGEVAGLTYAAVSLSGPTQGIPIFGHELLILPPFLSFSGFGAHDFPIPMTSALIGVSHYWQGARVEFNLTPPGFFVVLTNALDVVYGL